jgi:hypothetical protein
MSDIIKKEKTLGKDKNPTLILYGVVLRFLIFKVIIKKEYFQSSIYLYAKI